jgi:hypothetical protein
MKSKCEGKDGHGWSDQTKTSLVEEQLEDRLTPAQGGSKLVGKAALMIPLSICTASWTHAFTRDISGWIARPSSVRRKEAKERGGFIARPLNSFMLYRFAYIEKARAWCGQNKEQALSQVIAASWNMETREVRQCYERYAETERTNHLKAHPAYKFSPRRTRLVDGRGKTKCQQARRNKRPRDAQLAMEGEVHLPFLQFVDVDTTSGCHRKSDCDVDTLLTWPSERWETSITFARTENHQHHLPKGTSLARYCVEEATSLVDERATKSRDASLPKDAQGGIQYGSTGFYQCMCFSCMCCTQSTVLYNGVYNTYHDSPATVSHILRPEFPICGYSTLFGDE